MSGRRDRAPAALSPLATGSVLAVVLSPVLVGLAAATPGSGSPGAPPAHPPSAFRYLDGAPPGHTGGFGEPTCARCHFGGAGTPPAGELTVEGLPDRYEAGARYPITVRLAHPGMGRAGFEAAIRFPEGPDAGGQAGTLEAVDDRSEVVAGEGGEYRGDPDVRYARHTAAGTALTTADTARWALEWTAPAGGAPVVVHLTANAANDDASEFGDRIYVDTLRIAGGTP